MRPIIFLGADHAGFEMKNTIKEYLKDRYEIKDFGASSLDPLDDFTTILRPLAEEISKNPDIKGIVFGGSGQGEAQICNRYKGVRAAVYYGGNLDIVKLSGEHNDANVLAIGARFIKEDIKSIVDLWLNTAFLGEEKYERRNKDLDK